MVEDGEIAAILMSLDATITAHFEQNSHTQELKSYAMSTIRDVATRLALSEGDVLDRLVESARRGAAGEMTLFFLERLATLNRRSHRRTSLKRQLADAGLPDGVLGAECLSRVALIQNRGRGALYEQIAAALLVSRVRQETGREDAKILICPGAIDCRGSELSRGGYRLPDILIPDLSLMVEFKSGYTYYNKFVREQIRKDKWIIANSIVKEIWWFLFYGGSSRLLTELEIAGIKHVDIGIKDN